MGVWGLCVGVGGLAWGLGGSHGGQDGVQGSCSGTAGFRTVTEGICRGSFPQGSRTSVSHEGRELAQGSRWDPVPAQGVLHEYWEHSTPAGGCSRGEGGLLHEGLGPRTRQGSLA